MFQLKAGLHQFPPGVFGSTRDLVQPTHVRDGDTMLIACSGQGTAPDDVSFARPGRLFVVQHLGASMPSKSECETHQGHSCEHIEESFRKYDFRNVIVCGHLRCQVIRHWLQPISDGYADTGGLRSSFENGARDLVEKNYSPESESERCTLMICEHVLCQIDNLLTLPFILKRVKARRTAFHGWVIDDDTARVFGYSREDSAFIRIKANRIGALTDTNHIAPFESDLS